MKKALLAILLAFSLTSAANTALAGFVPMTVTIDAPDSALVDTVFTVDVVLSGLTGGEELTVITDFAIGISGIANTPGVITKNPKFDGESILIYPNMVLVSSNPPHLVNGDILFSFNIEGDAEGTLNFDLVDKSPAASLYMYAGTDLLNYSYKSLGPDYGPLTVVTDSTNIVPEPGTLLLLGLGGLLLRRRKSRGAQG